MELLEKYIGEANAVKYFIRIKAPNQKEWRSKSYDDYDDAYDDFGKYVMQVVKKNKLDGPQDLVYRYIDIMVGSKSVGKF